MCYNLRYLTKKQRDYAVKFGESQEEIDKLEKQLEIFNQQQGPVYHTSAFDHWPIPVVTSDRTRGFQFFHWGLIPGFVRDSHQYETKYTSRYLNARIESLFDETQYNEKFKKNFDNPFYSSALKRRCVIVADGYYDWHWQGKTSYNFHIQLKSEEPMLLAGIWRTWKSKNEELQRDTVAIVTTDANPLCQKVHNRPKASEGPRQLAILDDESAESWLNGSDNPDDIEELKSSIKVYPEEKMKAYPVKKLFIQEGRSRIPLNDKDCIKEVNYPELSFNNGKDQMSLF